jgi:hypothetical protein
MSNKEWLKTLKAGDEVFVNMYHLGYRVCRVEKITEKFIKVHGFESKFRMNGTIVGSDIWNATLLEEYTEEKKTMVLLNRQKRKIIKMMKDIDKLDASKMQELYNKVSEVFETNG